MKLLIVLGLLALAAASPQRFRARPGRRQARQEAGTGYLAPAPAATEYGAPADPPALYAAPEDEVQAASELDSAYLAPAPAEAEEVEEEVEADAGYLAPAESELDSSYLAPAASDEAEYEAEAPLDSYAPEEEEEYVEYGSAEQDLGGYEEEEIGGYEDDSALDAAASEASGEAADPLKMLMNAVPGVPGEDYPIYAETPETAFSCDGQVDGGYYADEEAECQVFHICTADGAGGLAKYSFLCPNGTIFNQNYFICDWWFNVDCAESAALAEAKNSEVAGARAAADEAAAEAAASDAVDSYAAPAEAVEDVVGGYLAPEYDESYDASYDDAQAAYGDAQQSYQGRF